MIQISPDQVAMVTKDVSILRQHLQLQRDRSDNVCEYFEALYDNLLVRYHPQIPFHLAILDKSLAVKLESKLSSFIRRYAPVADVTEAIV